MKGAVIRKFGGFALLVSAVMIFALFGCGRSSGGSEPDSFRNIKWGADFSSLSGFAQIAGEGDLAFYERMNEKLQVEGIDVERVVYGFHKGRFYTAMVYLPAASFTRMREVLTGRMGEPAQPDKTPSKLAWDGSNVTVLLTSSEGSETARLAYLFKPVQLEIELKK